MSATGEPIIDRWRDGDARCHCTHCEECGRLFRTEELSAHMRQAHLGSRARHHAHREVGCRMLTLLAAGIRPDGLDAWVETELQLRDENQHLASASNPWLRRCCILRAACRALRWKPVRLGIFRPVRACGVGVMSAPIEKRHRESARKLELARWESESINREAAIAQALADLEFTARAAREKAIRDCASALANCGDVDTEGGGSWLLNHFAAELSPAKAPGR